MRLALFGAILARHPDGFFQMDSVGYWQLAQNLNERGVFSQQSELPYAPDHLRTPLYPLFLAGLQRAGAGPVAVAWLQVVLGAVTCALVVRLARELTGRWDAAWVAGGFAALDVPSISLANSLLSETLFTALLVGSALGLVAALRAGASARPALTCGGLLGLAILCRPLAMFLPLVWAGVVAALPRATPGRRLRSAAALLLACGVVVAPWLARNQTVFGTPFLTTIGQRNLLEYRAAAVYAEAHQVPLSESRRRLVAEAAAEFPGDPQGDSVAFDRFKLGRAATLFAEHPALLLRNHAVAALGMLVWPLRSAIDLQLGLTDRGTSLVAWGESPQGSLLTRLRRQTSAITLALVAFQLALLAALWAGSAVAGIAWLRARDWTALLPIASVVLYCSLIAGGPENHARFRVPLVPFLAVSAGLGLCLLREHTGRAPAARALR